LSSHNEIMDFDLLVGNKTPFLGFGEVIQDSRELEKELHRAADQVRHQIRSTFGAKLDNSSTTPKELDDIAEELWETGWDPEVGNVALFTRDLGLLLTEATLDLLEGRLIFRSASNVIHWSIFWADHGVEAFPFHPGPVRLAQEACDRFKPAHGPAEELMPSGPSKQRQRKSVVECEATAPIPGPCGSRPWWRRNPP